MHLLFTDCHLDDQPQNDYRWLIFEHVRTALVQYDVDTVFCLGDLVDYGLEPAPCIDSVR